MSGQMGHSFDVATLLGIGDPDASPLPEAVAGEIVIRVPAGISFRSLRKTAVGGYLLWQDNPLYESERWSNQPLASKIYRFRFLVAPDGSRMFVQQKACLNEDEEVAPLTLVVLVLLCMKLSGIPDPLNGGIVRCAEVSTGIYRMIAYWDVGRLYINHHRDDNQLIKTYLAAARKL